MSPVEGLLHGVWGGFESAHSGVGLNRLQGCGSDSCGDDSHLISDGLLQTEPIIAGS